MLSDTLDAVRSGIPGSAADVSSALAGPVAAIDLSSRWEGRTVHVVFSRGEREPVAVVKVDTLPRYRPRLHAEHAALEHAAGLPGLSGRAPRSLGLVDTGAGLVLTQSAVPGVPMSVLLS